MPLDGFMTNVLTRELKETLLNGRIHKVFQPFQQDLQLVIRSQRTNYRLNASIHPNNYRLHLTEHKAENPKQAPMFTMIMRKHIENAQILDIRQYQNDRIVIFDLSGRDDIGDMKQYELIFELMGKHSNILLVDKASQRIIDCMKHVSPEINSYRTLQPNGNYILPPQNDQQVNITSLSDNALYDFITEHTDRIVDGQAHQVIQGLSKIGSQALQSWMNQENLSVHQAVEKYLQAWSQPLPYLLTYGKKSDVYFMPVPMADSTRPFPGTFSQVIESYFQDKVQKDHIYQLSSDVIHKVEQSLKRNYDKLNHLADDRKVAENSEDYRIYGELLSAFAHQVTKGMKEVALPNYYDDNQPLVIPLKEYKSPIENSQMYFKKYAKYRDSLKYIDHQISLTRQENDYLEGILVQLNQADVSDVEDIKQELQDQGIGFKKNKSIKKRAKSQSKPRRFRSSDGVMIYVGRNNQQNDYLSLKQASKNHWWFHAKNIPGAHVIIESDKPSEQTMTEAAQIAAYYSKSQQSANVPVDTVPVKNLRKPNGAKPGFVIYEGQKTLYVTPEQIIIDTLAVD